MTIKARFAAFLCALAVACFLMSATALPAAAQNPPGAQPLHNQDVLDLFKSGLSPEIVMAKIKSSPVAFDTSAPALKALKDAGVPDTVIVAMLDASAPKAAPGAESATSDEFAHIRVYRARRYAGSGLAPSIFVDGVEAVRVGSGRHCSLKVKPGSHEVRSDDKSSVITLDARAGREYYVRVDEETGFWKGHGKLTMMAPEQGVGEFRLQKPVEPDRRLAKELIESDCGPEQVEKETPK